jgi:hypothetical protein
MFRFDTSCCCQRVLGHSATAVKQTDRGIKAEGRGDRRDDLQNQSVQVCKARLCDVEATLADVVDSFVVNLKGHHQRRNHRHRKDSKRCAPGVNSPHSQALCAWQVPSCMAQRLGKARMRKIRASTSCRSLSRRSRRRIPNPNPVPPPRGWSLEDKEALEATAIIRQP